jgi:hypothetical protein
LVEFLDSDQSFIPTRGRDYCRGCSGKSLFSALNLGELPIANELQQSQTIEIERFPLHLRICRDCGLGQVADVVTPERIFRNYRYLSSMSSTFLAHAEQLVAHLVKNGLVGTQEWVLEIASNDGYLLRNFAPYGISVLGIEPARNIGERAIAQGIETITEFFSNNLASQLHLQRGSPKIIIANNVMAHVPNLMDFLAGLKTLCSLETKIIVENPTLVGILKEMQFDTIYHEHYSYLSVSSVYTLCKKLGLKLVKVEALEIHGGSNRYWIENESSETGEDPSVQIALMSEKEKDLFAEKTWQNYANSVKDILQQFESWLESKEKEGKRVYGYGAAAKASTLLNAIKVRPSQILAIADVSNEKQDRFMPPNGIRIISPAELYKANPSDIVIFPWNIEIEICKELRKYLNNEVKFWSAIPFMHEVKNNDS